MPLEVYVIGRKLGDKEYYKDMLFIKEQEDETMPYFIEEEGKYDGVSTFCNIDVFSAQGCQLFPGARKKRRHVPKSPK